MFRDVTQRRLVVSDVSGQPIFSIFKGQAVTDVSGQASVPVFKGQSFTDASGLVIPMLKDQAATSVLGQPFVFSFKGKSFTDVSGQLVIPIFKNQAVTNVSGQRSFPHLQGSSSYLRLDTTYRFHLKRHAILGVSGQPINIFNGHEVADVSGQAVGRMFKRRAVQLLDA